MSKNDTSISRKDGVVVTKGELTRTGRVVWKVTHKDGKRQTFTTSRSSNVAIKDGATIYREALKSLAKR